MARIGTNAYLRGKSCTGEKGWGHVAGWLNAGRRPARVTLFPRHDRVEDDQQVQVNCTGFTLGVGKRRSDTLFIVDMLSMNRMHFRHVKRRIISRLEVQFTEPQSRTNYVG